MILIKESVSDAWKDNDRMTGLKGVSYERWSNKRFGRHQAFVGGLASLASTWVSERSRNRREFLQREIAKRETTYSEFIELASRLYAASATHRIDDDAAELAGMVSLYAVSSRIRLFASEHVIKEAEKIIDRIVMQYGADNLSAEQLGRSAKKDDPLKAFSIICRSELQSLQVGT